MTENVQVLIVDDDKSVQRTLIDILDVKHYHSHSFTSGTEALEWAYHNEPAVALIDLRLQEMSGLDVIDGIKQNCPNTECIILTGFASQESAIEAMNLGVFGYLEKPYEMDHLLLMIRNAADKWQSGRALQQRTHEIELLYQTSRRISQTLNLEEIYTQLHQLVISIMPCDTLVVSTYDPVEKMIHAMFVVDEGEVTDASLLPPIPLAADGTGIQSTVIRTRKPMIVNNYPETVKKVEHTYLVEDGNVTPYVGQDDETITKSGMALPIVLEDQVSGVIQVMSQIEDAYSTEDLRIMEALMSQVAVAANNAKLYQQAQSEIDYRKKAEGQLQKQIQRLSALHNIDIAITASMDFNVTMNILLDHIVDQLAVDAAGVLSINQDGVSLDYVARRGYRHSNLTNRTVRLSDPYISKAILDNKLVHIHNINLPNETTKTSKRFAGEGFVTYFVAPLVVKGKIKGLLEILHRAELKTTSEWRQFLDTLATQTAIALDTTATYNDLQRSNMELALGIDQIIELWIHKVPFHTKDSQENQAEITAMTVEVARSMNVSENNIVYIRRGAMLHDIGMLQIPKEIIEKEGKLTDEEMELIRKHPIFAQELLSPIRLLRPALDIPYMHHERWDGSGYPLGLESEHIPLAARIFAVVDVWHALVADRPYRKAWTEEKAVEYLREQAGVLFDPKVVNVFLEQVLRERKVGV